MTAHPVILSRAEGNSIASRVTLCQRVSETPLRFDSLLGLCLEQGIFFLDPPGVDVPGRKPPAQEGGATCDQDVIFR